MNPAPVDSNGSRPGHLLFLRLQRGIIPTMEPAESTVFRCGLPTMRIIGHVGLALLALLVVITHRTKPRKAKAAAFSGQHAAWVAAPAASAEYAASPDAAAPRASVAGLSIWPLPIIASIAQVCRLREVTISRIGGLYGP